VRIGQTHPGGVKQSCQVVVHVLEHHVHAVRTLGVLPGPVIPSAILALLLLSMI
jgi:hypothetical protein